MPPKMATSVYIQTFHSNIFLNYEKIYSHTSSHRDGILKLLQCDPTRAAVAEALKTRASYAFEEEATAAGMCVSALRTFTQWDSHPQSQTLKGRFPIEVIKIADSPPRPKSKSLTPLEGIRMLELTRVLAGPTAGRTVAGFGADVLWITSPKLPALPLVDIDTSRGKRAAQLDLTRTEDAERLRELVSEADVFLQSYRPGSLTRRGFSPEELAQLKPGIIVANLRGYGWEGPWAEKRAVSIGFAWQMIQAGPTNNVTTFPVRLVSPGCHWFQPCGRRSLGKTRGKKGRPARKHQDASVAVS